MSITATEQIGIVWLNISYMGEHTKRTTNAIQRLMDRWVSDHRSGTHKQPTSDLEPGLGLYVADSGFLSFGGLGILVFWVI